MLEITDLSQGAPVIAPAAPLSLALGSFDGVHIGHRALLEETKRAAAEKGLLCAVWTFDCNPSGAAGISSDKEKERLFASLGMRYMIRCPFEEVRRLPPEEFVRSILAERLGVGVAVCGFNHRFGHMGAGDPDLLTREMAKTGAETRIVDPVMYKGKAVSSSRIRTALADGDIESANAMLARPFALTAPVIHGNEIGRTIGFPTVNQHFAPGRAVPKQGVYACRCMGAPAVANIGTRPTVTADGEVVCETHIIGYRGDLYESDVTVEFLAYLRQERKFPSLAELSAQLERDAQRAKEILKSSAM